MVRLTLLSVLSVAGLTLAGDRTFTVINNCLDTIWPAVWTALDVGSAVPYGVENLEGWEAPPGTSKTFSVPDQWRSGRIWARTGCNFAGGSGPNSCLTGGCNGGGSCPHELFHCNKQSGTGIPPVTVAKFNFEDHSDWYEVSLREGFNLPVHITNDKGCGLAGCAQNLNIDCPTELQGPKDSSGRVMGCKNDCLVDPTPTNSGSCCTGSHTTPATCPTSGIPHYQHFKTKCPNTNAYAFDEATGLFSCPNENHANYVVTFCPIAA